MSPRSIGAPLKEADRTFGCVYRCAEELSPKKNGLLGRRRGFNPQRRLTEPDNLGHFHHTQPTSTTTGLTTGPLPGVEQQIIRAIKTIRKKN